MTVSRIDRDVYLVQLPLPFALRSVNCYLLRDAGSWTIIDTGLHTPDGEAGWNAALAELAIEPQAISQIVLTHFHPDHYGMAGWLQERSGAPVLIAEREAEQARQVWGKPSDLPEPMLAHFVHNGVPESLAVDIASSVAWLRNATQPAPEMTTFEPGVTIEMGRREFVALHTPGHSDGQVIFYDEQDGLVLAGDHVLIKITPHIGVWPESEANPLARYMASLRDLQHLAVRRALPGHGRLIDNWAGRLSELLVHHDERLEAMQAALGSGATAYTTARAVFSFDRFTPHEIRFAVAETIAHLDLLVAQGTLRREVADELLVNYLPV
jgi:glyoxylase-like metal-dependent hydrolase (beta-lactamase superfamily II)